jgi:hypothetical protein
MRNKTVRSTFAYAPFSDQIKDDKTGWNEGEKHYHQQSEGLGPEISADLLM